MRAVVTVTGSDRRGIIAAVSGYLAEKNVNILDISQTILGDQFAMVMLVDMAACTEDFAAIQEGAEALGKKIGMSVRLQHEGLFNAMHTI